MKKTLLLSFLVLAGMSGSAQVASLMDGNDNVVNGQTIVHWGDSETMDQSVSVYVLINGNSSKTLNVRRYEIEVEPTTQNYFCWGVCYGAVDAGEMPVWQAQPVHALLLEPGVVASNFHAYHSPMGVIGSNTYRYVWFDVEAPNDSVWVDINFQVTSVGIEEAAINSTLNIYPNPVTTNEVMISYQWAGRSDGATVAVRNMVGQVVLQRPIISATGKFQLSVVDLTPGVYFATIEHQDQIMATQRIVISQ
ncbi:MAG: T9SS type A sorting domain-containing protein [Bacteroidota bacterium]|nr:T9SS type A sorting domain-containing protein [Bacteroidota bacterium]